MKKYMSVCVVLLAMAGIAFSQTESTSRPDGPRSPSPRVAPAAVKTALGKPTRYAFDKTPLCDALQQLAAQHHVNIWLDRNALREARIKDDLPITAVSGAKENLEAALDGILTSNKMAWGVRDDVIFVTTDEDSSSLFEVRVYKLLQRPDSEALIEQITSQIDPTTWMVVGGPGMIELWAEGGAFVVSQTQHNHRALQHRYASSLRLVLDPNTARPAKRRGTSATFSAAKLGQSVECDFTEASLQDVVKQLSSQSKLDIRIDEKSIESLKRRPDTSVTCKLHGVRLASALNLITKAVGLKWITDRNSLQITITEQSDDRLIFVSYDVRDIPAIGRAPETVVDYIMVNHIDPPSWEAHGGPGTIASSKKGAVLEVRQTFQAHQQIEQLLAAMALASRP